MSPVGPFFDSLNLDRGVPSAICPAMIGVQVAPDDAVHVERARGGPALRGEGGESGVRQMGFDSRPKGVSISLPLYFKPARTRTFYVTLLVEGLQ